MFSFLMPWRSADKESPAGVCDEKAFDDRLTTDDQVATLSRAHATPPVHAKAGSAAPMRDDFLEFGGQPFKFPESCSDRYGPYLNPIPSHGSTPLGGNAFEDLPKLIERIDSVTGYRMPAERKLLRGLLQRVIDHLTGHLPLALDTGTVSVEQHAMLRVTNKALEDEVFALREELHRLHDEFTDERSLLNKCMEGAMPARTAHAISVKAANDLHAYLTCLINTHPYYDEPFTPGTGNPGRLPLDALTCAFPTRRSLALATSQQILAIAQRGRITFCYGKRQCFMVS